MSTSTVERQVSPPAHPFSLITELRRHARPRTGSAWRAWWRCRCILIAFKFGGGGDDDNNGSGAYSSLVDLATAGGANFTLFTLLVASWFLLVVAVSRSSSATRSRVRRAGEPALPAGDPCPRARLLGVKLVASALYAALALVLSSARHCSPGRSGTAGTHCARRSRTSSAPARRWAGSPRPQGTSD